MAPSTAYTPVADGGKQAQPKKRRKRVSTSGASDDCFTCHKLGLPCDRKRPYCSPCLKAGNECTGYKTTLTWGVGVASRGKLRGLSLPVAGTATNHSATQRLPARRRKSSISSAASSADANAQAPLSESSTSTGRSSVAFSASLPPVSEARPIKVEGNGHLESFSNPGAVGPIWAFNEHPQAALQRRSLPTSALRIDSPYCFSPPHSMATSAYQYHTPDSMHSVGTYSDAGIVHHMEDPSTPASYAFSDHMSQYPPSLGHSIPSPFPHNLVDSVHDHRQLSPTHHSPPPSLSQSAHRSSHDMSHGVQEPELATHPADFEHYDPFHPIVPVHDDIFQQFEMTIDDLMEANDALEAPNRVHDFPTSITPSVYNSRFSHLPPRMQQLFDYYDKHICSALVAFDGASNPYRTHILRLAAHNEGLQNAIAALATNNMRMREQKQVRGADLLRNMESFGPAVLSNYIESASQPSDEEACYKALAVEQLNMQLARANGAEDDAVLATLLILCLFHVCDSGFSKFKTQLVGVQKLLALRGRAGTRSPFVSWVQMFFTWVDVITSTVNDRETEIDVDVLDSLDLNAETGTLEQISGCDVRLFKLIGRLGRLNVLSQGRPARMRPSNPSPTMTRRPMNFAQWRRHTYNVKPRSTDPSSHQRLDGNGWHLPLDDLDAPLGPKDSLSTPSSPLHPDDRTAFWDEWREVRGRLQTWSMDYSRIPDAPNSGSSSTNTSRSSTPLSRSGTPHSPLSPSSPSSPRSFHPTGAAPTSAPAVTSGTSTTATQRDTVHANETFRAAALLYTERLARPTAPSSDRRFQSLVAQAVFHVTSLSEHSCVAKFLLWPLFIVGTEAVEHHHRAVVRERCVALQAESGFVNNLCVLQVLERTWSDGLRAAGETGMTHADPGADVHADAVRRGAKDDEPLFRPGFGWGPCGLEGNLDVPDAGAGEGPAPPRPQAFRWRRAMDRLDGEYIVV